MKHHILKTINYSASVATAAVLFASSTLAASSQDFTGPDGSETITVTTLDDTNVYDCAWLPTFFFKEEHWKGVIARIVDALKPGGTIVLGRFDAPADPVARAAERLQTVRGGGASLEADHAIELLREAGCTDAVTIDRSWPLPVDFTVGRKPA